MNYIELEKLLIVHSANHDFIKFIAEEKLSFKDFWNITDRPDWMMFVVLKMLHHADYPTDNDIIDLANILGKYTLNYIDKDTRRICRKALDICLDYRFKNKDDINFIHNEIRIIAHEKFDFNIFAIGHVIETVFIDIQSIQWFIARMFVHKEHIAELIKHEMRFKAIQN